MNVGTLSSICAVGLMLSAKATYLSDAVGQKATAQAVMCDTPVTFMLSHLW